MFRDGYMAKKNKSNQDHKEHNEKNMGLEGLLLTKNK